MTMMTEDREREGLRRATGERGTRTRRIHHHHQFGLVPSILTGDRQTCDEPRVTRESSTHAGLRARANG
jgi:hypothetical protein